MAFSRSNLQSLASKLIKVTTGDLAVSATFTFEDGPFDYSTQTSSKTVEAVDKVAVTTFGGSEFDADDLGVVKVEVGDVKMFVAATDLSRRPEQSTIVEFGGDTYSVINSFDIGGAGAAYVLQLRK